MGSEQSHFYDNMYTPCGTMLRKMGIRQCIIKFENVIIAQEHFLVEHYDANSRHEQIKKFANTIKPTIIHFIHALLSQGVSVVIFTEKLCNQNGQVLDNKFIFQGSLMLESLCYQLFDQDIFNMIHIYEGHLKDILKKYGGLPRESLIIYDVSDTVRHLRHEGYNAILVDDHNTGIRI